MRKTKKFYRHCVYAMTGAMLGTSAWALITVFERSSHTKLPFIAACITGLGSMGIVLVNQNIQDSFDQVEGRTVAREVLLWIAISITWKIFVAGLISVFLHPFH